MAKTKKLIKIDYYSGAYALNYCSVRKQTQVIYKSFEDVLADFPLTDFDIKVQEMQFDQYMLFSPF